MKKSIIIFNIQPKKCFPSHFYLLKKGVNTIVEKYTKIFDIGLPKNEISKKM